MLFAKHKIVRLHISMWLMLFSCYMASGQSQGFEYPITHYGIEDGLPQAQITSTFLDKHGFLWIGTHSGITLFDGKHFHNSSFRELNEEYVTAILKGENDVFINTLNNVIRYDGEVHHLVDATENPEETKSLLLEDRNGVLILMQTKSKEKNNLYISENDTIKPASHIYPELSNYLIPYGWGNANWKYNLFIDDRNNFIVHDPIQHSVQIDSSSLTDYEIYATWRILSHNQQHAVELYCVKEGRMHTIFRFKDSSLVKTMEWDSKTQSYVPIHPLAPDCFLPKEHNSNYLYIKTDSTYKKVDCPKTGHTRNVFSANGQIYVTSDEGLFIMHTQGIQEREFETCRYPMAVTPKGHGENLLACYEEGVMIIDESGEIVKSIPFRKPYFEGEPTHKAQLLTNYIKLNNKVLFGSIRGFGVYDSTLPYVDFVEHDYAVESFAFDQKRKELIIGSKKLYWVDTATFIFTDSISLPRELIGRSEPTDLLYMPDGNLWVAGREGIAILDTNRQFTIYSRKRGNFPNTAAISLEMDQNHTLWAGTTNGIYFWNGNTFTPYRPHAITENINQLIITKENELIAVSPQQISVGIADTGLQEIKAVFNKWNGYLPNEPSENGISIDANRNVWIPLVNKVIKFSLDDLPFHNKPAKVQILSVNDKSCLFGKNTVFPHIEGPFANIELGISDAEAGNWQHQYRLNEGELSPPISGNTFLLSNMLHDNNQLHIISSTLEHPDQIIENELTIYAQLPFWERNSTMWVIIGVSILSLIFLAYISLLNKQKQRKLQLLQEQLQINRLQTIQAYLNPHFIFNTLTAIQESILNQSRDKGNEMIVRLSRSFRYVLNYEFSKKTGQFTQITSTYLEDELNLIRDYVYLQEIQYEDEIEYIENIDPQLDVSNIRLPGLLLQPFVENAYKHAFLKPVEGAKVILSISKKGNVIHIQIEDNGCGKAKNSSSQKRNSWGKKLALERMEILNKLGVDNDIKIQHSSQGTIVNIKIEMNYEGFNS